MNDNTDYEGEKPLSAYALDELQTYIGSILGRFKDATDKEVRRILRNKWKELTTHYNKTVNFEAYRTNI